MKKIIFTITITLTSVIYLPAQEIKDVFPAMPESVIFGLEDAQKELLISDPSDTAEVTVDRGTYGELKRLAISPDFISLQTSEIGTLQIKLLPLINDSKIICLVKTVCSGENVCDSQIQFYTTKWMPISRGELFPKKNKDWFIKTDADRDSQDFKNASSSLDMNPMRITLSPTDDSLTVTYDVKNYLSEDDYKKIEPYLTGKPKVFNWDRTSFSSPADGLQLSQDR
jgi:hypothetical protein